MCFIEWLEMSLKQIVLFCFQHNLSKYSFLVPVDKGSLVPKTLQIYLDHFLDDPNLARIEWVDWIGSVSFLETV